MKKIIFILSLFILYSGIGQINQKKLKKIKKKYYVSKFHNAYSVIYHKRKRLKGLVNESGKITIKAQYKFLTDVSTCNTLLASNDPAYSPNDGGGRGVNGFKNLKLITPDNKLIKNFSGKDIVFIPQYHYVNYFPNIFHFFENGKMGLMNDCGKIIVPAKYQHINSFNDKGQAVVFYGNNIQVIDTLGNELLKQALQFDVDYNHFFTVPVPGKNNFLFVEQNRLIGKKNNKYGVMNIKTGKTFIPFEYDKINIDLIKSHNDTIGYIVKKNGKETIIDFKSGKKLLPFVFYKIYEIKKSNGHSYVKGKVNRDATNYFCIGSQKMLFPDNKNIIDFNAIDANNFIVRLISKYGIYNTKTKSFILKPQNYFIQRINNKFVLINNPRTKKYSIFNVKNAKVINTFDYKPDIKYIYQGKTPKFYKLIFSINKTLPNGIKTGTIKTSFYTLDFKPILSYVIPIKSFSKNDKLYVIFKNNAIKVFDAQGNLLKE